MAKKYFLILLAVLVQGCTTATKVDSRFDPASGLGTNEGTIRGMYMHPIAMARSLTFPTARRPRLVFQGADPSNTVEIQADASGEFYFKAPAGKYRLVQITALPETEVFEAAKSGFEIEIFAEKNVNVGSFYSSCDQWNDNSASEPRFQELISKRQYDGYKRYDAKTVSCLILHQKPATP